MNITEVKYDSYGYEDSSLSRVYYHEELDLYVRFSGRRCSYEGEVWDKLDFVKPVKKEILFYE